MSDRDAARVLHNIEGIGDWCAGRVLQDFLGRADIMLYGDLTIRNYLNDLYDIGHTTESETYLRSAADFDDTPHNRSATALQELQKELTPHLIVGTSLMMLLASMAGLRTDPLYVS